MTPFERLSPFSSRLDTTVDRPSKSQKPVDLMSPEKMDSFRTYVGLQLGHTEATGFGFG